MQPRGIAVTFDRKHLITANKNTSDLAVFSLPRLRLVKRIHVGHSPEFIKSIPPATGCLLRFAADTGVLIRSVDLKPYGIRLRAIKVSPLRNEYSVTMEASGTLLTMDMNFNIRKSVPTAAKPYGESFDRAGKRIFVAAALAGKLQVFDADSLNLLAEALDIEGFNLASGVIAVCLLTRNLHQILRRIYTLLDVAQARSDRF